MASRIVLKDTRAYLRSIQRQIRGELRKEALRVRNNIRLEARSHRRTGQLERRIRARTGVDAFGPYARITTSARNPKTRFRYGLAIQQRDHYMQRGLAMTPRR